MSTRTSSSSRSSGLATGAAVEDLVLGLATRRRRERRRQPRHELAGAAERVAQLVDERLVRGGGGFRLHSGSGSAAIAARTSSARNGLVR